MFKVERLKRKCRAHIDGELTIYHAAALRDQLLEVLDDPRELELNLAGVTELDTAGAQLLMTMKKERAGHGRSLTLTNHSACVLDAFELLGLVGYFNDPVVLTRDQGEKHGA